MIWQKTKSKPKRNTRQKLIDKLDTIFSLYIRLRDSNEQCICKCITSGEYFHYTKCDAGHFITRNNMATRWDEGNVNAQGQQDNRFLSGKQFEHGQAIDRKYGKGTADMLLLKSKSLCQWRDFEIESMIEKYKVLVKELKVKKGIK